MLLLTIQCRHAVVVAADDDYHDDDDDDDDVLARMCALLAMFHLARIYRLRGTGNACEYISCLAGDNR